jgi:Flp pilus assembly protein TadB
MKDLFYKYASSKNPQIDTHNIHEALDNWTWIWVVLEAWFVLFCTGVTLLFLTSPWVGVSTIVAASIVGGVLCLFYFVQCCKYAKYQVDEILSDPERKKIIKRRLNALHM